MSVKVTRKTPQLDKAQELLAGIEGRWSIDPRVSEDAQNKLAYLASRGRPFLAVTPALEKSALRYMRAELSFEPSASPRKLLLALAAGAKAQVTLRFAYRGADVALRPLTAEWMARKIARGLDPRVGIATRALVTELAASTWTVSK